VSTQARTATEPVTTGDRLRSGALRIERLAARYPLADLLAGAAMLLSGAVLLHWLSRLTFWRDEWGFLLHRRGWSAGTFLDPAVEHLVAIPILIYKLLLEVAGMDSPAPFQVVAVITFLASIGLLYVYVRPRAGAWLALAAILPILFLGPAWDDLLFPYQMTWFGSGACGIAALLCLERHSSRWDVAATTLLSAGLLFSDAGIPFVAGALVEIAMGRDRFGRAYVALIPTLLWIVWYLGWGHTAHTFVSGHNLAQVPNYVLDGLSSSLAVLLGLSKPPGAAVGTGPALAWGRPLLVAALVAAGWRMYQIGKPSPRLVATSVILIGFWSLTGLNASVFGLPTVGRYQYFGVVLIVLVASELVRGLRVGRWALVVALAGALAATASNLIRLKDAAAGLAGIAQQERGGLAALELARDSVAPDFVLTEQNSGVDYLGLVDARSYLSAVDAFGSPAYPPQQLASAPAAARVAADMVSKAALGIALQPAGAGGQARCLVANLDSGPAQAVVPQDGFVLRAQRDGVRAALRRYASPSFPVDLGALPAGRAELLRIPADRSSHPWMLQLSGRGQAAVCQPGPSSP
jgi:hypothetical protein